MLCLCAILGLVAGSILGQEKSEPPKYKYKKSGEAEWTISGQALKDVRKAIANVLVAMDWKILDDTDVAESISATKNVPSDFDPNKRPKLFVGAAMEAGDVTILAFWYMGGKGHGKWPKVEAIPFYDEFFSRLEAALK